MADQETVVPAGQNYSGSNRIPNIKQFMERLDKDKKDRDAKIDSATTAPPTATRRKKTDGEAKEHQEGRRRGNNRRTVKDPVTGRDVEIDDMDDSILKEVEDPQVRPIPFSDSESQDRRLTVPPAVRTQRQLGQGNNHQD